MANRLDTRLESEAAEFLVLGNLLLERIAAYKTYTNMPGYDLVATNPEGNTSAKIQVKSRWRTNAPGFPIKNFGCDFVVFCRLNRGTKKGTGAVRAPEYYVFPVDAVRKVWNSNDTWGKIKVSLIPDSQGYLNRWDLIRQFLEPGAAQSAPFSSAAARSRVGGGPYVSTVEFQRRALTLDGQTIWTTKQKKPFVLHVDEAGMVITPTSSGIPRRVGWGRMEKVLEKYNESGSTDPTDYVDVTRHGSYFLAILQQAVDGGATPNA
jgi:hypothetical protein